MRTRRIRPSLKQHCLTVGHSTIRNEYRFIVVDNTLTSL